jgi:hypothetical protein
MITETHLDLALHVIATLDVKEQEDENSRFYESADKATMAIVMYIVEQADENGEEIDEDEVEKRLRLMLAETVLNGLARKGLIEAELTDDGEEIFKLTDEGKDVADYIRREGIE